MQDEIKVSRPQMGQPGQKGPEHYQPMSQDNASMPSRSSSRPWIILGVIVVLLVLGGVIFRDKLFKKTSMPVAEKSKSEYQAVFLTNGQVYFGKLVNARDEYVTLTDIYYLQVGPQQGSGTSPTTSQQSISLVKLGNELH